jgi:diguanylate cyclase (GGDEF)-like protein
MKTRKVQLELARVGGSAQLPSTQDPLTYFMSKRTRTSTGLNNEQFQHTAHLDRLYSARRFLWRSSVPACIGLALFWVFDVVVAGDLALPSLAVRLIGVLILLVFAFLAKHAQNPVLIETLLCVPAATLTLCVALAARLSGGDAAYYAGGVSLMFCLSAVWLVRKRTFYCLNLFVLAIVSAIGYHWLGKADIALLLLCLLGILCGALFLDFLSRLSRRALRLQLELKTESRTDALTGLPNRRAFLEDAEDGWQRALRRGKSIAVMIIDADHFKEVNDQFGHDVGDAVLQALASAIANALAGPQPCGRLGGEEFGVMIHEMSYGDACQQAERVRAAVQHFGWALEQLPQMQVSIGLAFLENPKAASECSLSTLMRHADQALYLAKHEGRNRAHCVKA